MSVSVSKRVWLRDRKREKKSWNSNWNSPLGIKRRVIYHESIKTRKQRLCLAESLAETFGAWLLKTDWGFFFTFTSLVGLVLYDLTHECIVVIYRRSPGAVIQRCSQLVWVWLGFCGLWFKKKKVGFLNTETKSLLQMLLFMILKRERPSKEDLGNQISGLCF